MSTLNFRITNLTCDACIKVCTMLLKQLPGVSKVFIDQATGTAVVEASAPVEYDQIRERLESKKYKISALSA